MVAAKRVVYLSILFTLLIINLGVCSAYRTTPRGPSETILNGRERWSSSDGDFGMTEVAGIGIGRGGGTGIGGGDSRLKSPEQPNPPSGLDHPKPPAPDPEPELPGGHGIGIGTSGGGGGGIGIGKHLLLPPNIPTGSLTEYQADKSIRGQLTGLRCQPLNCHDGDCGLITMYFETSTSTGDEDELKKNDIHNTATAMTPSPDHVHDQMMMGNMEGDENTNGHKTVEAGEPDPDYSQMMSNKGSWTGLAKFLLS